MGGSGDGRLTRRALLRNGSVLGIALFVPLGRAAAGAESIAIALADEGPVFLTAAEMQTLRGLVDRFIPGQPEDPDPGAVAGGCAEAIDALLGAFRVDPPLIYAGAPFSDRAGHPINHFEDFLTLDAYEEAAWRLRIEGSQGRPELEFNGPVTGWQTTYREGLAALDAAAPGDTSFGDLPAPAREAILRTSDDPAIDALVDIAFPHTLEFMYGAPEYGGNRDLVGWDYTNFMGDVQPRGFTDEEVENQDDQAPTAPPVLPDGTSIDELVRLAPLASTEAALGIMARSGGRLRGLQREIDVALRRTSGGHDAG